MRGNHVLAITLVLAVTLPAARARAQEGSSGVPGGPSAPVASSPSPASLASPAASPGSAVSSGPGVPAGEGPGSDGIERAPGEARKGLSMESIWLRLAKARVLVSVNAPGPEMLASKPTGRWGWMESLRALGEALEADPDLAGKIHEVIIDGGSGSGQARVDTPSGPSDPVKLRLTFAMAKRNRTENGPLMVPTAADIRAALAGRGPRAHLPFYEYDERFACFLAQMGLGLKITVECREAGPDGTPLFHAVLAAYGKRVGGVTPTPRDLGAAAAPAGAGALQNLQDVLAFQLDARGHPQLQLWKGSTASAGLRDDMSASFPRWATRSPQYAYVQFSGTGADGMPDLDAVDRCMADWVAALVKVRGTPAEASMRRRAIVCGGR